MEFGLGMIVKKEGGEQARSRLVRGEGGVCAKKSKS